MRELDRLAVAQAVAKVVNAQVRTGDPDNLRGRAEAEFRELMDSEGADKVNLRVNGKDVGTMSVTYSKAHEGPEVTNEADYDAWLSEHGEEAYDLHLEWLTPEQYHSVVALMRRMNPPTVVPAARMPRAVEAGLQEGPGGSVLTAEGEVVPGMTWVRHPKAPKSLTIRGCEPEKVSEALGGLPASEVIGLVDGGLS